VSDAPAAELAVLIEKVSGNVIPPAHYRFLAETARERAAALGLAGVPEYVRALADGDIPGEWSSLLPHVTIKESFLFRHPQQFEALGRQVLPTLAASRTRERGVRVWSAGCARGEEPATLAIVLAECRELAGWEWRVLATDVDEQALVAASAGVFGERAVAQVPADLRSRYLARRGDAFELSGEIARRIEYRALNLAQEPSVPEAAAFDVVFLRNVLIYFRPDSQRRVAAAVARALAPDGVLFLGPAETLWQLSGDLEPVDLGDCFCYRHASRRGGEVGPRGPGSGVREEAGAGTEQPAARPEARPRPVAGRPASVARAPVEGGPPHVPAARSSEPGLTGTRERLAEAVHRLAEDRPEDAAALVDEALLGDPSDPTAHALEGFLHELSGRTQTAVASYRAALFLDPALAQVRLLLADALRRLGHLQRAALEYREVLASLAAGAAPGPDVLAGLGLPGPQEAAARCRDALVELRA